MMKQYTNIQVQLFINSNFTVCDTQFSCGNCTHWRECGKIFANDKNKRKPRINSTFDSKIEKKLSASSGRRKKSKKKQKGKECLGEHRHRK